MFSNVKGYYFLIYNNYIEKEYNIILVNSENKIENHIQSQSNYNINKINKEQNVQNSNLNNNKESPEKKKISNVTNKNLNISNKAKSSQKLAIENVNKPIKRFSLMNVQKNDLNDIDKLYLKKILMEHFLFKDKSVGILSKIIDKIEIKKYKKDNEVISSEYFYIIKEGEIELINEDCSSKIFKIDETFGEIILIENKIHNIHFKCLTNSSLFQLRGDLFREIISKINESELKERLQFISLVPIFKSLSSIQVNNVANSMYKCEFNINQNIFTEGDKGESLFIIKKGVVACSKNDEVIRNLRERDFFGENALLFNEKRSLSIYAIENTTCYQISQGMLISSLGDDYKEIILQGITKDALKNSYFLKIFENEYFFYKFFPFHEILNMNHNDILISGEKKTMNMTTKVSQKDKESEKNEKFKKDFTSSSNISVEENEVINNEINKNNEENNEENNEKNNDENNINLNYIYIIITGDLFTYESEDLKNEIILAKRGELFGDYLIKENKPNRFDIKTHGGSKIIKFDWDKICKESFGNILEKHNGDSKKLISFFNHLNNLKKIEIFKECSNLRLIDICLSMKKEKYLENEIIFNEGDKGDKFYFIKKGKVECLKSNKFIRELEENSCFGEISLLKSEVRSATIKTKTKVSVYTLTRSDFKKHMDKNMLDYLNKKIALQDNFEFTLNDLYFCKSLGHGKFGTVSLVHNNKNFYAMKLVKRAEAEKQKILIKYFITERLILLKLDHPFIMKLVRTFKTDEYIFYMTEFINGRVFSKYIENRNMSNIKNFYETQFYLSFLFVVLDYLNHKNICHRDLKPDNIMLDEKGYLKVIDFGTSIEIKNYTSTITGTPHYISPEVLVGKSYSFSCDYWSVGIIAHEIFYNFYPFGNKAKDPMDVYREIIKKDLKLPKNGNLIVNNFIKNLLKKKISERICSFDKVKKQEFYKDFKWDDLMEFKLNAPYIPNNNKILDFDNYEKKYLDFVEEESKKGKKSSKKVKSDEVKENKNDKYKFEANWADIF